MAISVAFSRNNAGRSVPTVKHVFSSHHGAGPKPRRCVMIALISQTRVLRFATVTFYQITCPDSHGVISVDRPRKFRVDFLSNEKRAQTYVPNNGNRLKTVKNRKKC